MCEVYYTSPLSSAALRLLREGVRAAPRCTPLPKTLKLKGKNIYTQTEY